MKIKVLILMLLPILILVGCKDVFESDSSDLSETPVTGNFGVVGVSDSMETGFSLNWAKGSYLSGRTNGDIVYSIYVGEGEISSSDLQQDKYLVKSGKDLTTCALTGLKPNTLYSYIIVIRGQSDKIVPYKSGTVTTSKDIPGFVGKWHYFSGDELIVFDFNDTSFINTNYEFSSKESRRGTVATNNNILTLQFTHATGKDGVEKALSANSYGGIPFDFEWNITDGNLLLNKIANEVTGYSSDYSLVLYPGESAQRELVDPAKNLIFDLEDYFPQASELVISIYYADVNREYPLDADTKITTAYTGKHRQYYIPRPETVDNILITAALNDAEGYALSYDEYYSNYLSDLDALTLENDDPYFQIDEKMITISLGESISRGFYVHDELISVKKKPKLRKELVTTYSIVSKPEGSAVTAIELTNNSNNHSYTYSFTPDMAGVYNIEFKVDDGFSSATENVIVSVWGENQGGVNVEFE